jgi:hypothetical protein
VNGARVHSIEDAMELALQLWRRSMGAKKFPPWASSATSRNTIQEKHVNHVS